jgi:uncharacterized protein (TIGR00645 family)
MWRADRDNARRIPDTATARMQFIEKLLEQLIFNSRWLLAPFYLGMVVAVGMILVKFVQEFTHLLPGLLGAQETDVVLAVLALVDMSLIANLLLIIIFSGYENFVSKIDTAGHEDRPDWMGKVDFSGLKVKVIASIMAISAVELLRAFVRVAELDDKQLAWKVGIHITLVASGVLFALMDRIAEGTKRH